MSKSTPPPQCTVRQIVDEKGNPYKAFITERLWVGTQERDPKEQDPKAYQAFSGYSEGNKVLPLTTGKKYFEELIKAIRGARETVYINNWQANWDALLSMRGGRPFRLFDLLMEVVTARPNLHVYLLLWNDTDPIQTYEDETASVLATIISEGQIHVCIRNASVDTPTNNTEWHLPKKTSGTLPFWTAFSHHQKQVVVDGKVAFIGGLDLAYGRYDDDTYELQADAHGRTALNRYNPCISAVGTIPENEVIDPHQLTGNQDRVSNRAGVIQRIQQGAHQIPYEEALPAPEIIIPLVVDTSYKSHLRTLDPARQPRMPWQDVEVQIEGPAVNDLALNFILCWNRHVYNDGTFDTFLHVPKPAKELSTKGGCKLQVLRSASKTMRDEEYSNHIDFINTTLRFEKNETRKTFTPEDKARFPKPNSAQDDIYKSMLNLIYKAEHFIYIENQFFVSNFGEQTFGDRIYYKGTTRPPFVGPAVDVSLSAKTKVVVSQLFASDPAALPSNEICAALGNRIRDAILDCEPRPFHVYITLPVSTELSLGDATCLAQIHWTMQTLVFGTHSLLNRIRRALKQRELMKGGMSRILSVIHANVEGEKLNNYKTIPINDCFEYVTLLNLRNWAKLGDRYVTEQVYVHTKCMIVDDLYVLVGSANINDRSLLGERDSELSVMIEDTATERKDICGTKRPQPIKKFAHELRKSIWSKIFGITGVERSAKDELQTAIEQPANPESWKKIQAVAQRNTQLYEAAFNFIPRNKPVYEIDPAKQAQLKKEGIPTAASIWPVWNYGIDAKVENGKKKQLGKQQGFMPFHTEFWVEDHHQAARAHLEAAQEHEQAADAHKKAADAHQVAAQGYASNQQGLKTRLDYKVDKKNVLTNQTTTGAADNATNSSAEKSKNAKRNTDNVSRNYNTKTTVVVAEIDANLFEYSSKAVRSTDYLVRLFKNDSRNNDDNQTAAAMHYSINNSLHTRAAKIHQENVELHIIAAAAHAQAAENHEFTHNPEGQSAASQLIHVKGYITLLPIHWTEGENINMGLHPVVIT